MAAEKSQQDAIFQHAQMIQVGIRKNKTFVWVLRCNFCNKFLSEDKMLGKECCYHCNKDLGRSRF